jgi:hypothetical protein
VSKEGARVGVKEMRAEEVQDRTQRAFVKTWNAAQEEGVGAGSGGSASRTGSWATGRGSR